MDTERQARRLLKKHGVDAGELREANCHTFADLSECHQAEFSNCRIHFHFGKEQWAEYLKPEDPELRIRSAELSDGTPVVAASECFSC